MGVGGGAIIYTGFHRKRSLRNRPSSPGRRTKETLLTWIINSIAMS